MFFKENNFDSLFHDHCATYVLQVALPKTLAGHYSEFEQRFNNGKRYGLCGLTLWQAQGMDPRLSIDDLLDADTNIRIACKFLRCCLKTDCFGSKPDANYWDVLEFYTGEPRDRYKRIYFYYANKPGEPASYEPREMEDELYRRVASGKHEL